MTRHTAQKFEGLYTVADGYANQGGRPHHVRIMANQLDLHDDMTDDDLRRLYEETLRDHFETHITCEPSREDDFVSWAREQIKDSA